MTCCRGSTSFAAGSKRLESVGDSEPRQPGVGAGKMVLGADGGEGLAGLLGLDEVARVVRDGERVAQVGGEPCRPRTAATNCWAGESGCRPDPRRRWGTGGVHTRRNRG